MSLTGQFTHWVQGTTTASFGAGITVGEPDGELGDQRDGGVEYRPGGSDGRAQRDGDDGRRSRHVEQRVHGDQRDAGADAR